MYIHTRTHVRLSASVCVCLSLSVYLCYMADLLKREVLYVIYITLWLLDCGLFIFNPCWCLRLAFVLSSVHVNVTFTLSFKINI